MRKIPFVSALLITALCLSGGVRAIAETAVSAESAIVISGDTGEVIFEKNADARMLVASTTKIMTALVVLENSSPDEAVIISPESVVIEGSSMYLKPGESYTVAELLYGMMLVSGNDAAHALALHAGGSVEGFAELMNAKAEALGLKNTSFRNPHGLDAEGHYSSARDLAVIMREAMRHELFRRVTNTRSITIKEIAYYNHNRLLGMCEGVNGGKTGYTMAAGRSLVSSCERGGTSFIVVTLNDPEDWRDHGALYDWAYGAYEYKTLVSLWEYRRQEVISGSQSDVGIAPGRVLAALLPRGAEAELRIELPGFAFAGIRAGERAGLIIASFEGRELGRVPLCYMEDVPVGDGIRLSFREHIGRGLALAGRYGLYNYGFYPF